MVIDLNKIVYSNDYKMPIEGEVVIPDEMLKSTDIKAITPVKVKGYLYNNEENYSLEITVSGEMTLSCARTLKDVKYPFNINIEEVIGENDDNSLEIIQNRVDIFPIIWQNILVEVPLRVLHPDSKEESLEGNGWRFVTEDDIKEEIDPRLAKLSEYNKE